MRKICIDARAKVNLTLDVLHKRQDGYHEVEMIMQSINLKDRVVVEKICRPHIEILVENSKLPTDQRNLAFKAAKIMMDEFNLERGVKITLHKEIPLAAGLAGGSSDAAAVILAINELFDIKKTKEELMPLGKCIGADVPFCLLGGTALATGIGEQLRVLDPVPNFGILLIKPPYTVSTREVYSRLNIKNIQDRPNTKAMLESIKRQDIQGIAHGLCNVLEEVTFTLHPELKNIKEQLLKRGALGSLMSGSGPTVFGIFESKKEAFRAAQEFSQDEARVFVTEVN